MNTRQIGSLRVSEIGLGHGNSGFVPGLPPGPIFRFLGEPRFARDFQMGKIRIPTFRRCRSIEDEARRDAGEGNRKHNTRRVLDLQVSGLSVGEITIEIQSNVAVEHAFVLCFTERNDGFSRGRFGRFGVEVSEPGSLFTDLTKAIRAKGFRVVESIASKVFYHERTFVSSETPPLRTELLKPPIPYADEREVRFVWRLLEDPGVESLDLVLPETPSGCRVLDGETPGDPSGAEAPSG